jgi:hypothetical protein
LLWNRVRNADPLLTHARFIEGSTESAHHKGNRSA